MRVGDADLGIAGSGSISAAGTADALKIGVAGSAASTPPVCTLERPRSGSADRAM
jgi:hypothetical protein